MKTAFLFVSSLLLLIKCQKDESDTVGPANLDQEFEIALNESVKIKGSSDAEEGQDIGTIEFSHLDESRCPANAMCIRQGAAVTTFRIFTNAFKEAQTVRLFIGDFMANDPRGIRNRTADTVAVQLASKAKYILILKKVSPYPGTSDNTPKAMVTVKME